ncbi:unnamed protein product [Arctogadus glacialis]
MLVLALGSMNIFTVPTAIYCFTNKCTCCKSLWIKASTKCPKCKCKVYCMFPDASFLRRRGLVKFPEEVESVLPRITDGHNTRGQEQANYQTRGQEQANYQTRGQEQANYQTRGQEQANYQTRGQEQASYQTRGQEQASYHTRSQEQVSPKTRGQEQAKVNFLCICTTLVILMLLHT